MSCLVICIGFVWAWAFIARTDNAKLAKRKKWIDQLPNVISTLGVLGTFLGITVGLMSFDTSDLDRSIPLLLEGLKTAFFTSLFGMIGSVILNRIVSRKFDTQTQESEIQKAATLIVETLKNNHNKLPAVLANSNRDLVKALDKNNTIKAIRTDVEQLKDDVEEIKGIVDELKGQNKQVLQVLESIKAVNSSTADELPRLRAVALTATASISTLDNNLQDIRNAVRNIDDTASEMNGKLENINSKEEVF